MQRVRDGGITVVASGSEVVSIRGFTITGSDYTNYGNPDDVGFALCSRNGSDAIDAGIEAGFLPDIDGQKRPDGDAPDIGADEYRLLYLPFLLR